MGVPLHHVEMLKMKTALVYAIEGCQYVELFL